MSEQSSNIRESNAPDNALVWIMSTACMLFLVPLVAMQFTNEMNWDETDFLVWAMLLFGAGSACLWVSRKVPRSKWLGAGALIALMFAYTWAELAVGIFTNLGS